MRKIVLSVFLLSVCMSLFIHIPVYGESPEIKINGEIIYISENEQQAMILNGRTLVPLRVVMEELGFIVNWSEHNQRATLLRPRTSAVIWVGHSYLLIDGQEIEIDVPAQLKNERILVPVRAIAEATGFTVDWDADNFIVSIFADNLEWDYVEPLNPIVSGINISFNASQLLEVLEQQGMELLISAGADSNWGWAYSNVENPVRDGRIYNEGGRDIASFFFRTEELFIHFNSNNVMERIMVSGNTITTSNGIRVGDSREQVLKIYGIGYMISPLVGDQNIQYFDGDTYLIFWFRDGKVSAWQVANVSIFELESHFL